MSSRNRTPSLLVTSTFLLVALAAMVSSRVGSARNLFQTQNPKPQDREALAKGPAPSGTLKDRLATDDGYAAVLFYSADIHGNLEVCGCPIHPLGGLARRLGYIDAFRQRSPDAATLMVDAGHIFSDDLADKVDQQGLLRADARVMNDWVVRADEQMNLEVSNLSYRDLPYLKVLLRPGAENRSGEDFAYLRQYSSGRLHVDATTSVRYQDRHCEAPGAPAAHRIHRPERQNSG